MTARQNLLRNRHNDMVQAEVRFARDILRQNPGMSWGDALRAAARILERERT